MCFFTSRTDYCNSLLQCIWSACRTYQQRVLNAAARLVDREWYTPFARAALATGQTTDSLQDFAFYIQDHPQEIASLLARVNFT